MTMPKRLDKCPISPECTSRLVWQAEDGSVYRYDNHDQKFTPHTCTVRGSEKPRLIYMAEWFNRRTGRTRWIGPFRMRRSVEIVPKDGLRIRNEETDRNWVLKKVYESELDWKPIDD